MSSTELLLKKLDEAILDKDVEQTLACILVLKEQVKANAELIKTLTEPTVIRRLHEMLVEHLEVPPKLLLLGKRVPNRHRRAILFVQTMENGVRRVLK